MDAIVLIGFMGSGKTTLGRDLAARLDVPFVDLDAAIEARTGLSAASWIRARGEAAFRRAETIVLGELAAAPRTQVVATGGGVVETPANRPLLRRLGRIVWLRAASPVCRARLAATDAPDRPLADEAVWEARWAARQPVYAAWCDHVLDTDRSPLEATAAALYRWAKVAAAAPPGGAEDAADRRR